MNTLIPGAYFNVRAAREQILRGRMRDYNEIGNVINYSRAWERAADGLERNDPQGIKLSELLRGIEQDRTAPLTK